MADDCLFCKIIKHEIPADVVFENEQVLAFRDIQPQAPTHVLFIPKKHIAGVSDFAEKDSGLMDHLFWAVQQFVKQENIEHYRLTINNGAGAGQSVFHLHVHLLSGRAMKWPPG